MSLLSDVSVDKDSAVPVYFQVENLIKKALKRSAKKRRENPVRSRTLQNV